MTSDRVTAVVGALFLPATAPFLGADTPPARDATGPDDGPRPAEGVRLPPRQVELRAATG